jgi:cellulose synthase/poly-beta-1,6-N-acetylglucosamine synthase-like glycosyltransferase
MNSLIIAFYKNLPALELIFLALENQSTKDFEIIIAEDAEEKATTHFIEKWQNKKSLQIEHVSQTDNGFRKTKILNAAIAISKGDYLIFIDGDCIPHKHFIKAHSQARKEGFALFGRRVMLSSTFTNNIIHSGTLSSLNQISLFFTGSKRWKYGLYLPFIKQERKEGIWGCNWSIAKKEIIAIGGYDENYVHAGVGEDIDIEWRLVQKGIRLLSIRFGAIVYHLHHEENYDDRAVNKGSAILNTKKNRILET